MRIFSDNLTFCVTMEATPPRCFLHKIGLLLFLLLQPFWEAVATNIALNKSGIVCRREETSMLLFDGDTTQRVDMLGECFGQFFLDVELGGLFVIDYAVIFAGNVQESELDKLDFFILYNWGSGILASCSQYPGVARANLGMRANCLVLTHKFHSLKIQSLKNEGLTLSEIEVHSFEHLNGSSIYQGCFEKEFAMVFQFNNSVCLDYCFSRFYLYAGIKGKECGCSNNISIDQELPPSSCPFLCEDGLQRCGGNHSYTIYLTSVPLPTYFGCLPLDRVADNVTLSGDMTVLKCLRHCEDNFYAILWNGDSCFCKDYFRAEKAPVFYANIRSCNSSCTGDPHAMCGSVDHVSIYLTCSKIQHSSHRSNRRFKKCSELFHCEGAYNVYGECPGGCHPDYRGTYCLEREYDSCNLRPCDESSTKCRNLGVTYTCDCLPGFEKEDGHDHDCIEQYPYVKAIIFIVLGIMSGSLVISSATIRGRIHLKREK